MKTLLQQLAGFNTWANQKLTELILSLPEDLYQKEVASSFPSIHFTLLHMWSAEHIWWQRLKLAEYVQFPGEKFTGNFEELSAQLLQLSQQWFTWIQQANDVNLTHVFAYQNSKKEHFKQPVYEMLLHLFNHQSFHRGQIVSMLRQLGADKIPPTDFIVYSRSFSPFKIR